MAVLRIGINALYLIPGGVGGTEIYLRDLLANLAAVDQGNEYVVFTNRETGPDLVPEQDNFFWAPQPVRAVNRPARILWEQFRLPEAVAQQQVDVLFNPGFTAPAVGRCPSVTVFHDLQHKRHPEHFRWFDLPFWRLFLWTAVRRSRLLIAVSEATRADLLRYYRVPPEKIRVVPHGVDPRFFEIAKKRRNVEPDPYLLCVSTLHPHKNLERLIRAFHEVLEQGLRLRLIIAGLFGFHTEPIVQLIRSLDLGNSVFLTGWIPREQLFELFMHAFGFVYPSTFEGFGMPVLEALAAGLPTACSSIEPLATMAGPAALQFEPEDQKSIRDALYRLASDGGLRASLTQAGPRRAAPYSWYETARATLAVLREAAGQGRADAAR